MARHTRQSDSSADLAVEDDRYGASPLRSSRHRDIHPGHIKSVPSSPASSVSSDKENQSARSRAKGKDRVHSQPHTTPKMNKRKRVLTREGPRDSQDADESRSGDAMEDEPDQTNEERRELRKQMRDLSKNLVDNRAELLRPENDDLQHMILDADEVSGRAKQTADAAIGSRLLVNTSDLVKQKVTLASSGGASHGIDMGDFINKCKRFMRQGEISEHAAGLSSTQRRRREDVADEVDDDDSGDMPNWEYLGRHAALPNIRRPGLPGFLLGPLSIQRRQRRAVVRRAAFRPNNIESTRPEVLQKGDLERSENTNLTTLCTRILARLRRVRAECVAKAEAEFQDAEDMSQDEVAKLFDRYHLSDSGQLALFRFVVNPFSFGQTVENLFYVSFLIRDGKVGLNLDSRGMPYLAEVTTEETADTTAARLKRHQAVIGIDMRQWEELIELYEIEEPMIPHRAETEPTAGTSSGWYA